MREDKSAGGRRRERTSAQLELASEAIRLVVHGLTTMSKRREGSDVVHLDQLLLGSRQVEDSTEKREVSAVWLVWQGNKDLLNRPLSAHVGFVVDLATACSAFDHTSTAISGARGIENLSELFDGATLGFVEGACQFRVRPLGRVVPHDGSRIMSSRGGLKRRRGGRKRRRKSGNGQPLIERSQSLTAREAFQLDRFTRFLAW